VFQPGGLSRSFVLRLWWGAGATGGGCPAAAGGGHGLLVGSEPLPEAVIDSGKKLQDLHGSSQIIWASESARARGTGSYEGPHMNQA
jgi:hypothetical protein